jgi:hypothetical protein
MKATSPMNLKLVTFCVVILDSVFLALPAIGSDKIPALASVPMDLPAPESQDFVLRRADLETQLKNFQAAAYAFNSKRAADQTDEDFNSLESQRRDYIKAAKAFNTALATAIKNSSTTSKVAHLQKEFESLNQEIALDRQVIRNFGFEKTVDELEYWESLPARQIEDAKDKFKGMLFDAALGAVSDTANTIGSLDPREVDALSRLAVAEGEPSIRMVGDAQDIHKTLEFLDKSKTVYEAADAIKKRKMLEASVELAGLASRNPAFGLLLKADTWILCQVGQSVNAVYQVHRLTQMNEADLILLKSRSQKLKAEVDQLTSVKKELARLSSQQDSTELVEKPR